MKKVFYIFVFLCIYLNGFCISNGYLSSKDSVPEKRPAFGTLKINPFQFMFCEIPISLEIYRTGKTSAQFQAGFIFPARNTYMAEFFESWGVEGHAQDGYVISYKRSPYNNDFGLNLKIEFRKFKKSLSTDRTGSYSSGYFAPQLMYKFTFYNHQTFTKKDGTGTSDFTYESTESKYSNIFGFGLMFGHQSCHGKFVSDLYGGFGLRITGITSTIHEKDYGFRPTTYPGTVESYVNLFPFFNLGWRMGFELKDRKP